MKSFKKWVVEEKIKEINSNYNYSDENPNGKYDSKLVACGQCDGYNELLYIYNKYLKGKISDVEAIKALGECCAELKSPRNREDFYACLKEKLNIDIKS